MTPKEIVGKLRKLSLLLFQEELKSLRNLPGVGYCSGENFFYRELMMRFQVVQSLNGALQRC